MRESNRRYIVPAVTTGLATIAFGVSTASAQSAPLFLDPKAMERKFGTLASLIGTTWANGQEEVIDIKWDKPGEGILILRRGLYGTTETYVVPEAGGKSLRYVRLNMAFGDQLTANVPMPRTGQFFLRGTPGFREQCQQTKASVACTKLVPQGKAWVSDPAFVSLAEQAILLRPIQASAAAPILDRIGTTQFPDRPEGSYDPSVGMIGNAIGQQWYVNHNQVNGFPSSGLATYEFAKIGQDSFLVAPNPAGSTMHSVSDSVFAFRINENGQFFRSAMIYNGKAMVPRTTTISVREGGVAMICDMRSGDSYCIEVRSSPDSKNIIQRYLRASGSSRSNHTFQFTNAPPKISSNLQSKFSVLSGKSFISSNGNLEFLSETMTDSDNRVITSITFDKYGTFLNANIVEDRFEISKDGALSYKNDAESLREISRFRLFYTLSEAEKFEREQSDRNLAAWSKEYKRRERQEFWAGVSRNVAAMTQSHGFYSNVDVLRPAMPVDWIASIPSPGAWAAGDMGTFYTAAPQMTPQQRAEWDELERIKIRDQLYRGEDPTTFAEDAIAKTNREIRRERRNDRPGSGGTYGSGRNSSPKGGRGH